MLRNIVIDPARMIEGTWHIETGSGHPVPLIYENDNPVTSFVSGWHPRLAYSGLASFYILEFQGPSGQMALWILARSGIRLGDSPFALDTESRKSLRREIAVLQTGDDPEGPDDGFRLLSYGSRRQLLKMDNSHGGDIRRSRRSQRWQSTASLNGSMAALSHSAVHDAHSLGAPAASPSKHYEPGACRISIAVEPGAPNYLVEFVILGIDFRNPGNSTMDLVVNGSHVATTIFEPRWHAHLSVWSYWLPAMLARPGTLHLELRCDAGLDLGSVRLSRSALLEEFHPDLPPADLMLKFESLGDNCEFGLVQRHFGAEPLGLLRFSGLDTPGRLTLALREGFSSLGSDENLRVIRMPNSEWWIREDAYGMNYHTFKFADQITEEEVLQENRVKLGFLKQKLVEDMEDGDKIFVFKRGVTSDLNEVLAIQAALAAHHADNRLLWVAECDSSHQPGDVEWVGNNLLRGYVDLISRTDAHEFDPDVWLRICSNAYAAFSGRAG